MATKNLVFSSNISQSWWNNLATAAKNSSAAYMFLLMDGPQPSADTVRSSLLSGGGSVYFNDAVFRYSIYTDVNGYTITASGNEFSFQPNGSNSLSTALKTATLSWWVFHSAGIAYMNSGGLSPTMVGSIGTTGSGADITMSRVSFTQGEVLSLETPLVVSTPRTVTYGA